MAGEYIWKTLEEISAKIERPFAMGPFGSNIRSENYKPSGVPVIRGLNLSEVGGPAFIDRDFVYLSEDKADELSSSNAFPGDIVFVAQGTVGKVGILPKDGRFRRYVLSQNLMKATVDPKRANPQFLFYYFRCQEGQNEIFSRVNPTGVPCISRPLSSLRSFQVYLPPLPEQNAIAHILGTLDDKIELNRRMSETLEGIARAIFKSWFVDFDPARAKVEGRGTGLPKHIADLFPDSFMDSELGEIPEGWEFTTIAEFASLNPEVWSKGKRPDIIHYVDLSNTKWGRIEAVALYANQEAPSRAQRVLRFGDTIVGTVRPGNGSYAFVADNGLTGSTGFAVLRPNKRAYAEFVYLTATSAENIQTLSHLADGGAYPAVRSEVVAATQVIRADDMVLDKFSKIASPLLTKIAQNNRESRILATLRDTLLPKLISGELRVKDAERFVEEVA